MEAETRLSPSTLIGALIDARYEVLDYVGRGTSTFVFRVWDQRLQHIVALKLLDPRLASAPEVAEAFTDGARRAAALPRHPNITQIYEMGEHQDVPFIVTEFVSGSTLAGIVANEGSLDVDRAFRIARQVALALAAAHRFGLVHRDLTPSNILVTPQDEVKVTDFGTAEAVMEADLARTRTLEAPSYASAAPSMNGQTSGSMDIYALGAILYEMLAGAPPHGSSGALVPEQPSQGVPDLRQTNPAVSPTAAAIVGRALSANAADRFPDAASFADALHGYLIGETGDTTGRIEVSQETERSPVRDIPAPSPPLASTPPTPRSTHAVAPPKPRSGWRPWATLVFLAAIAVGAAGGWYAYHSFWTLLNGSSTPAHTVHRAQRHPVRSVHHTAAPPRARRAAANACLNTNIGPVQLASMWAETLHPVAGTPMTFDYTIGNGAPRCQNVKLGLTALGSGPSAASLTDPAHESIVGAAPGTHLYKRQFVFPQSAAGQTFSVVLSVLDPTGKTTYGQIQVNNLITVAPR